MKFPTETELNSNAKEIIEKYKEYKGLSETDSMRPIIEFYIENKLKFPVKELFAFKSEKELETYLYSDKKFLMSAKEQIESARLYVGTILNLDVLKASTKSDARSKTVSVVKMFGIKRTQCDTIFDSATFRENLWKNGFVKTFVDVYLRKNVKTYLAAVDTTGFNLVFTDVYQSDTGYFNFDVEFKIKVEDLDEEVLTKIGTILMNLPSFI